MGRLRLHWQIAIPLAAMLVAGLLAVAWQATRFSRASRYAQLELHVRSSAALVEQALGDSLRTPDRQSLDPVLKRLGPRSGLRLTIVAPDGNVIADSASDPALIGNQASAPEIVAAIADGESTTLRSGDGETEEVYHASALRHDGRLVGVLRVGAATDRIATGQRELREQLAWTALAMLFPGLACAYWIARRIALPVEELGDLIENYAGGALRLSGAGMSIVEIERAAGAVSRMGADFESRIGKLVAERNEQAAVLSSMVEGVLAIDGRERVMAINAAAARLLDVDASQSLGRIIHEVARNADLQHFVADTLRADAPLERDVALHGDESRYIQAHGAPVRNAKGERIGAVVVLNDVTRLRRLETVRRDFVANVSHELKTPVTSIKGFLETLLAGAMDDPANARRFLEIVARQADRLGAIIEDLLVLSRIDQDSMQPTIEKVPTAVAAVVAGAVDVCRLKADHKGVTLEVRCEDGLEARISGALVEQALVNLIDNAIKYSEPGSTVTIGAARSADMVEISVSDRGSGIEAEHLPRLFERFYRVDKARSRSLGGTGLGLAIVKHIAQAQGGSVDVESKPGTGSTFTLRFPCA